MEDSRVVKIAEGSAYHKQLENLIEHVLYNSCSPNPATAFVASPLDRQHDMSD